MISRETRKFRFAISNLSVGNLFKSLFLKKRRKKEKEKKNRATSFQYAIHSGELSIEGIDLLKDIKKCLKDDSGSK